MARVLLAVLFAAALVLGGCILITGGTDGYTPAEAAAPEAGGLNGKCQVSADCLAAGLVCCLSLSLDAGAADAGLLTTTCQPSCPRWDQPCVIASDCGDGGECTSQSCTVDAGELGIVTKNLTTCGPIPICTQ